MRVLSHARPHMVSIMIHGGCGVQIYSNSERCRGKRNGEIEYISLSVVHMLFPECALERTWMGYSVLVKIVESEPPSLSFLDGTLQAPRTLCSTHYTQIIGVQWPEIYATVYYSHSFRFQSVWWASLRTCPAQRRTTSECVWTLHAIPPCRTQTSCGI